MTLWDVITSTRERYVEGYRNAIRVNRESKVDFTPELPVVTPKPDDVREEYRTFRVDFIWREDGQPRVGVFQPAPGGAGGSCVTEYPDGQIVRVVSLKWDECEFRFQPPLDVDEPLLAWLHRWSDRDFANQADEDGLAGVVHSTTPPQKSPDGTQQGFAVDFGSAPTDAFTALIATLLAAGVREIRVG